MNFFYPIIFFLLLFSLSPKSFGQEENNKVSTDTIPTLEFEQHDTIKTKKKKVKKKVFYGMKCRRGFTRKGVGDREVIESFYFLKKYKEPNPYVKEIYVYDVRTQKILVLEELNKKDVQFYKILHGPYKKIQGNEVIEQGIFYVGTKHGRWEKYAPKRTEVFYNSLEKEEEEETDNRRRKPIEKTEIEYSILLEKEKYYRGWPKEARISFYDGAHTKIKEVVPYVHGKKHGDYYYFKEDGDLLIQGKYIDGHKVGLWIEYYPNKKQKKRETKYPKSPYDEDQFEGFVLTEWDEKGTLTVSQGQQIKEGSKPVDPLKDHFKRNKKKKR